MNENSEGGVWNRFVGWIKRRGLPMGDMVHYSRFGLPGDEQDDRAAPQQIFVDKFDAEAPQFYFFGQHVQKAALVVAGIGMSVTLFVFLSSFFEFDWIHHEKGVDVGALVGMFLFCLMGMAVHWYVIKAVRDCEPRFVVPFILVYTCIIAIEALMYFFIVNHWIVLGYLEANTTNQTAANIMKIRRRPSKASTMILVSLVFLCLIIMQSVMTHIVIKCRLYLEKRKIHELEMSILEKAKQQYPGIQVMFGGGGQADMSETTHHHINVDRNLPDV